MRFDDRFATVLAQPDDDPRSLASKWRQLADLVAQHAEPSPERERALAFLRTHRQTIGIEQRRRIAAALPKPLPAELAELFAPASPIGAMVERIARMRRPAPAEAAIPSAFRWETGSEGIIQWVEGAERAPLIGQSIAAAANLGEAGVDGAAASAFGARAPFRDARLRVAGEGPAAGDWLISGVPFFDPAQGSLAGYRGSARRPRGRAAAAEDHGLFGTEFSPDSLRQLIHELRTPLNAILGFAEMIEGQFLGPAAEAYRARATTIRGEAARLLAAVDDLDTAARIETDRFAVVESRVDVAALLERLYADYREGAGEEGGILLIQAAPGLRPAAVEVEPAERMCARLLSATLGLAAAGEALTADLTLEGSELILAIARPEVLVGRSETELLDPGFTPPGEWPAAPSLGIGFALRLVRNLAETLGGALEIEAKAFVLKLPGA